jgi:hypothetical protein
MSEGTRVIVLACLLRRTAEPQRRADSGPQAGEATVISRYGNKRPMVIHPADFNRLTDLEQFIAAAAALDHLALSQEALAAHAEEGTCGAPISEPALLAELFG